MIFIVSDTDKQNRPKDLNDLEQRFLEIRQWIPQPLTRTRDNNMNFAEKAFTLFKDCGLITKKNVELLNDEFWCANNFKVAMNPLGVVLRREGLRMWDSGLRYYCPYEELTDPEDIALANRKQWSGKSKLAVICEGVTYYISNDWFAEHQPRPTKPAFADKLWLWAENAVKKNIPQPPPPPISTMTTTAVPVDLNTILKSLEELHGKVDRLTKQVEAFNSMRK